jgi:hypothetical protein
LPVPKVDAEPAGTGHAECRDIFGQNGQLDQRMQSPDRGLAALRRDK